MSLFLLSRIHHASRSFVHVEGTTRRWIPGDVADHISYAALWPDEKTTFVGTFNDYFLVSYSLEESE